MKRLKDFTADHRYLVTVASRHAGFNAGVAVYLDAFHRPLLRAARPGELVPIDGTFIRDWDPDNRDGDPGVAFGMRVYHIDGVRFVVVSYRHCDQQLFTTSHIAVVDRADYVRLYRIAYRCRRDFEPCSPSPVLPGYVRETLWANTIGYLDFANLNRIRTYGGRARRGILLSGPPGNGKTMACRWIWEECRRRRWQWRQVTPDTYNAARRSCDPEESIRELFQVDRRGIIFFDDMDMALRDRSIAPESDDQAVFLGALDGLSVTEGVVFVFTTNCTLHQIDRAFMRPGRLDVVLHLQPPDADLRRQLIQRWHADLLRGIPLDHAVATTAGYSFADVEEVKNLLIMHFIDTNEWSWDHALTQFTQNRSGLVAKPAPLGFSPIPACLNGHTR